jgi:hypothetical protein
LIHAVGSTAPDAYGKLCDLSVFFTAAKPVDGVCSAVIVRGLAAVVPGRAVVIDRYVFPVRIFIAGEFYVIDEYFIVNWPAIVPDDGKGPSIIVAYGVSASGAVLDNVTVFAGAAIYIGNMLASFFCTGTAIVGRGTAGAILCLSLETELFCGVALQGEGLACYGHGRTGIVIIGCR